MKKKRWLMDGSVAGPGAQKESCRGQQPQLPHVPLAPCHAIPKTHTVGAATLISADYSTPIRRRLVEGLWLSCSDRATFGNEIFGKPYSSIIGMLVALSEEQENWFGDRGSQSKRALKGEGTSMADGNRKRRHSSNSAKRVWYAKFRSPRFAQRFGSDRSENNRADLFVDKVASCRAPVMATGRWPDGSGGPTPKLLRAAAFAC